MVKTASFLDTNMSKKALIFVEYKFVNNITP